MTSRLTTRVASRDDVSAVMNDICEVHRTEWIAAFSGLGNAKRQVSSWVCGLDRCISADVGVLDEKPVVMFGVLRKETEYTTWLIATKQFFELGIEGVLFSRRYLRNVAKLYDPLVSASQSTHKDVDKWMSSLGYRKIGEDTTKTPPLKMYVYGDKQTGI